MAELTRKEILWDAGGLCPGQMGRLVHDMRCQYGDILRVRALQTTLREIRRRQARTDNHPARKTKHFIADFPLRYIRPNSSYNPGELDTEDGGLSFRWRIIPLALRNVQPVEAESFNLFRDRFRISL
jgi:hypothetical protein